MPRKALNDKGEERYKGNPRNARALVGRRIGERRREMGLTQQVLGETLGVSRETISKYETGLLDLAAETVNHVRMVVAKNHRSPGELVVNVLVSIDIAKPGTDAAFEEEWHWCFGAKRAADASRQ